MVRVTFPWRRLCLWRVGEGKSLELEGAWWWAGQRMPTWTKGESPWVDRGSNNSLKRLIYRTFMQHLIKPGLNCHLN